MSKDYRKSKKSNGTKEYADRGTKNDKFKGKPCPKDTRNQKTGRPEDKAEDYTNRKGNSVSEYVGATNDVSWYNRNARLIADASKFPFSNQLGAVVTNHPEVTLNGSFKKDSFVVPGIMSLHMMNIPGIARNASDGVNLATAGLFQFIRKSLSTVAAYAPADVMMYVLGLDEVYSMYANIARAFGIVNAYSSINLYLPKGLLEAGYGFSSTAITDFITNINTYRSRFNNLVYKASSLYLPTDFSITSRHAWLYSNYFMDGDSSKSQLYIHRMVGSRKLSETKYATGTAMVYDENGTAMDQLLNRFDGMIEVYRNSDSMLRIAADMRRAFEGRSQWKLAYIDEGYMVLPSIDPSVLSQIHNLNFLDEGVYATILNYDDEPGGTNQNWDITQNVDKNIIFFDPVYYTSQSNYSTNRDAINQVMPLTWDHTLNFFKNEITSDDILEATRNTLAMRYQSAGGMYRFSFYNTGVDLCVGCVIYSRNPTTLENVATHVNNVVEVSSVGNYTSTVISNYSMFDWAPKIFMGRTPANATDAANNVWMLANLENYTLVGSTALDRLNSNVMCSMWSIPEFGAFDA